MADYDALDHGVPWKWKRSFALIEEGAPPIEVAKALTATLRHRGGIPCLDQLVRIAEDVASGRESGGDAFAHVKRVERAALADGLSHIRDAAQVVKRLVIEIAQGDPPTASCREEITKRFCLELIEQKCFARARSKLMGETWSSYAEHAVWQAEVHVALEADIVKIAQRLMRDPSGRKVIAPGHPRTKNVPMAVLLNMPLDE